MQYGFIIPHGNIHELAELAHEAEEAGWDGVFYWDGIYIKEAGPMYDPWIVLAAMALQHEASSPWLDPHTSLTQAPMETGPRDRDTGPPLSWSPHPTSRVRSARRWRLYQGR